MEGHGAAERGTVVFVSLVVSIKHLRIADFRRFAIGLHFFTQYTLKELLSSQSVIRFISLE